MCEPVRLLGGRLALFQPATGHRAGTDAVLLAAAAEIRPGEHFVDVGSGVGTAGLALALRCPDATGVLLETDAATAEFARRNCLLNGVADRVAVAKLDLFDRCRAKALDWSSPTRRSSRPTPSRPRQTGAAPAPM